MNLSMRCFRFLHGMEIEYGTLYVAEPNIKNPKSKERKKPLVMKYRSGAVLFLWRTNRLGLDNSTVYIDLCGCPLTELQLADHYEAGHIEELVAKFPRKERPRRT